MDLSYFRTENDDALTWMPSLFIGRKDWHRPVIPGETGNPTKLR